jgi:hypothetical protein
MKSHGTLAICLGLTGNIQGTYHFLSLASGLVIKCCHFDELPAPELAISRVSELAANSGVPKTSSLQTDVVSHSIGQRLTFKLNDTPIAEYPAIPAQMPGVLID